MPALVGGCEVDGEVEVAPAGLCLQSGATDRRRAALRSPLQRKTEEMGKVVGVGLAAQVPLTQGLERRHVLDAVRSQMLELETGPLEGTPEEGAGRDSEAPLVESHERHHVAGGRIRPPFVAGDKPLSRVVRGGSDPCATNASRCLDDTEDGDQYAIVVAGR